MFSEELDGSLDESHAGREPGMGHVSVGEGLQGFCRRGGVGGEHVGGELDSVLVGKEKRS